jgi:TIR domain
MAEPNERNRIFISYSHKDKKFLDELLTHLKPLERDGLISAWSDKQITPGTAWPKEIERALASTKVAVLLVSKDFLASDFIHERELAPLLKKAEQGGLQILWTLVRACAYKGTPLANYQAVIPPNKPLAEMKAERDKAWVRICEEIEKAASASSRSGEIEPPQTSASAPRSRRNQSIETGTAIADISKQLRRLKIEWALNKKNTPGMFERADAVLKKLRATVIDLYTEIAEGQNPTATILAKEALDRIVYIENLPISLGLDLHLYWNEGDQIFDLLRRAGECLEAGI